MRPIQKIVNGEVYNLQVPDNASELDIAKALSSEIERKHPLKAGEGFDLNQPSVSIPDFPETEQRPEELGKLPTLEETIKERGGSDVANKILSPIIEDVGQSLDKPRQEFQRNTQILGALLNAPDPNDEIGKRVNAGIISSALLGTNPSTGQYISKGVFQPEPNESFLSGLGRGAIGTSLDISSDPLLPFSFGRAGNLLLAGMGASHAIPAAGQILDSKSPGQFGENLASAGLGGLLAFQGLRGAVGEHTPSFGDELRGSLNPEGPFGLNTPTFERGLSRLGDFLPPPPQRKSYFDPEFGGIKLFHATRERTFPWKDKYSILDKDLQPKDFIGMHAGTERAALDRADQTSYSHEPADLYELDADFEKPLTAKDYYEDPSAERLLSDTEVNNLVNHTLSEYARKGFDHIPYKNAVEDPGSLSYVTLDPNKIKILDRTKYIPKESLGLEPLDPIDSAKYEVFDPIGGGVVAKFGTKQEAYNYAMKHNLDYNFNIENMHEYENQPKKSTYDEKIAKSAPLTTKKWDQIEKLPKDLSKDLLHALEDISPHEYADDPKLQGILDRLVKTGEITAEDHKYVFDVLENGVGKDPIKEHFAKQTKDEFGLFPKEISEILESNKAGLSNEEISKQYLLHTDIIHKILDKYKYDTTHELAVKDMMNEGKSYLEIADSLGISDKEANNLMNKVLVNNPTIAKTLASKAFNLEKPISEMSNQEIKSKNVDDVLALNKEGYFGDDIAKKLNIPKSIVDKILKMASEEPFTSETGAVRLPDMPRLRELGSKIGETWNKFKKDYIIPKSYREGPIGPEEVSLPNLEQFHKEQGLRSQEQVEKETRDYEESFDPIEMRLRREARHIEGPFDDTAQGRHNVEMRRIREEKLREYLKERKDPREFEREPALEYEKLGDIPENKSERGALGPPKLPKLKIGKEVYQPTKEQLDQLYELQNEIKARREQGEDKTKLIEEATLRTKEIFGVKEKPGEKYQDNIKELENLAKESQTDTREPVKIVEQVHGVTVVQFRDGRKQAIPDAKLNDFNVVEDPSKIDIIPEKQMAAQEPLGAAGRAVNEGLVEPASKDAEKQPKTPENASSVTPPGRPPGRGRKLKNGGEIPPEPPGPNDKFYKDWTAKDWTRDILQIPQSLRAGFDISAFRNNFFRIATRPSLLAAHFKATFQALPSHEGYRKATAEINDPENAAYLKLANENRLNLVGEHAERTHEAGFGSRIAENIPIIGKGVEASERSYSAPINIVRFKTFKNLIDLHGGPDNVDADTISRISRYTNALTGTYKGKGKIEGLIRATAGIPWSGRNIAGRAELVNPNFYKEMLSDPVLRKELTRDLGGTIVLGSTVLYLTSEALKKEGHDVKVYYHPTDSKFGSIKVDGVNYNIWGGASQPIRLIAQLSMQEERTDKGVTKLGPRGQQNPFGKTGLGQVETFFENKLAPVPKFIDEALIKKTNWRGEKITPLESAKENLAPIPLSFEDLSDIYKDNPDQIVPASLLSLLGMDVRAKDKKKLKKGSLLLQ